jgi:nucleotide-binding universal stress UspA family protein
MKTLLVPLDGSADAEQALPYAESLARASGAQLILLRAVPAHRGFARSATSGNFEQADSYLAQVKARITEGVSNSTATLCGDPVEAIVEEIDLRDADLVVMATHARTGLSRLLHGSVTAAVVARATVPVLLVPIGSHSDGLAHGWVPTVLVPLDGSAFSERALPIAAEVARLLSAHLDLVEAIPIPEYPAADLMGAAYVDVDLERMQDEAQQYLTAVAEELRRGDFTESTSKISASDADAVTVAWNAPERRAEFVVDWQLTPEANAEAPAATICAPLGAPALAIADAARTRWAELVVMATHARTGLTRLINGSVAEAVVQEADRPVLLVPPHLRSIRPTSRHPSPAAA